MQTNSKLKVSRFNPAVLPLEYMPKIADVVDSSHSKHYLIPGTVFVSSEKVAVSTIVGTGVALCLWDSAKRVGGINHFLQPSGASGYQNNTKYAEAANEVLLERMLASGAKLKDIQARVFGGSQPGIVFTSSVECLGDRNVQITLNFLKVQGIRLLEKEVGGTQGRKVVFQTDDGRVWAQQL